MKNFVGVFVLLSFFGCREPAVDTQAEGEKLMQLSRDWSALAETGNTDSVLMLWSDDAVMMAPGLPPLRGKEAIRKYIEEGAKIPGFKISWEPLEVHVSQRGDMAYMLEQNQISFSDSLGNTVVEYNKAVTVWRKEKDGSWKNVVDMWSLEPPRKQ